MTSNVVIEYWEIDFDEKSAQISIEDGQENASIIVDLAIAPELERGSCGIKRIIDCWYLDDVNTGIEHTTISKEEISVINELINNEYRKYINGDVTYETTSV